MIPDPSAHHVSLHKMFYLSKTILMPLETSFLHIRTMTVGCYCKTAIKTTQYCHTCAVLLPRPLQALHCHLKPHLQNPNNLSRCTSQQNFAIY